MSKGDYHDGYHRPTCLHEFLAEATITPRIKIFNEFLDPVKKLITTQSSNTRDYGASIMSLT